MIKEDSETRACVPRWVSHDKNPTDALTKVEGAHFVPLAKLLATSKFCIRAEAEELEIRKDLKSELGYVPQPRTSKVADMAAEMATDSYDGGADLSEWQLGQCD